MAKKSQFEIECKKRFGLTLKAFIKQCAKEKLRAVEIAKKLKCSVSYVYFLADKHSITFNKGK